MKKTTNLAMLAAFAAQSGFAPKAKAKHSTKPQFTESELAELRALPKPERERRVAELKAKYRGAT